jgi:hypothetical protein
MSNHPHSVQASFKPCPRFSLSYPAPLQLKIRVMRHFVARPVKAAGPLENEGYGHTSHPPFLVIARPLANNRTPIY